jgi:hypothetical protein
MILDSAIIEYSYAHLSYCYYFRRNNGSIGHEVFDHAPLKGYLGLCGQWHTAGGSAMFFILDIRAATKRYRNERLEDLCVMAISSGPLTSEHGASGVSYDRSMSLISNHDLFSTVAMADWSLTTLRFLFAFSCFLLQ